MTKFSHFQVAISRLLNTLFAGNYYEMFSSRIFREKNQLGILIIDTLFFWEKNHCEINYVWEKQESFNLAKKIMEQNNV